MKQLNICSIQKPLILNHYLNIKNTNIRLHPSDSGFIDLEEDLDNLDILKMPQVILGLDLVSGVVSSRICWKACKHRFFGLGINPEYSLEGLILKLKLQYTGHLMRRINLLEKTLMLGKIEGKRRRGRQRMRWLAFLT